MKKLFLFLLMLLWLPLFAIRQEIRYVSMEATEVYLVWGVNNWNVPGGPMRPNGSFIKNQLLYTPMKRQPYGFSVELNAEPDTMIDFIFWISKGPAKKKVDVWDLNRAPNKDYHLMVNKTNIVLIPSSVKIRPKEALTILDFSLPILSLSATLFFLFAILRTYRFGNQPFRPGPVKIITASAIVLAFLLIFVRASITGQCWDFYLSPLTFFPRLIWAGFYDVMYVLIISCFFLLFLWLFRHSKRSRSFLCWLFVAISFFSLIAGIINIRVVEIIGKPFNYPWFYYSDFLKSEDAHAAVASNISFEYYIQILMICFAALFLVILIIMITDLLQQKLRMKTTLVLSLLFGSILYIMVAPNAIRNYHLDYNKLSNPVVAFVESTSFFSEDPELFTMEIADSLKFDLFDKERKNLFSVKPTGIINVIVFVMESTPAEYVQPYATVYKVTPELEKHHSESVVFENIYAHAPATNNSMVSILGSIYPWLSYNSITKEYPDIQIPTISSELKKQGYRTAFFNSADNRFQKAGDFLENRQFDEIKDCNNLKCKEHFKVKDEKWDYLDGKDDECTAEDLICWIKQGSGKPFFSVMWTYQTHYPYFVSGQEKKYTLTDPVFNRYLNALNHNDFVLGKILNALKQNGLYESTLVVVIGDHGEAFGRHDQTTHASGIYEENIHVPCILINPAFKGEHMKGIGGLVDIAPTIMDQLGYASPEQWHGKNLFTAKENDRVYFFTPWADYLFGYREGSKKYIFNATKGFTEMYDLKNDPVEERNMAFEYPEKARISHQRLAGWVQSVNQYMSAILKKKNND